MTSATLNYTTFSTITAVHQRQHNKKNNIDKTTNKSYSSVQKSCSPSTIGPIKKPLRQTHSNQTPSADKAMASRGRKEGRIIRGTGEERRGMRGRGKEKKRRKKRAWERKKQT